MLSAVDRARVLGVLGQFGIVGAEADHELEALLAAGVLRRFSHGPLGIAEAGVTIDLEAGIATRLLAQGRRYVDAEVPPCAG